MGDRISIQFKNGNDKSPVLFSHWGGIEFYQFALKYVFDLKQKAKIEGNTNPLYRLKPGTVIIDFIRAYIQENKLKIIESDLYLCCLENEGDNSDNGHFIIDL